MAYSAKDMSRDMLIHSGKSEASATAKTMNAPKSDGMVDMKRDKKAKKKDSVPVPYEGEDYPYGLRLNLEHEAMTKLGGDLPKVGKEVTITAKAKVTSAEMRDSTDGGKKMSCCLQITKMKVG